jgi:hypothetical protein
LIRPLGGRLGISPARGDAPPVDRWHHGIVGTFLSAVDHERRRVESRRRDGSRRRATLADGGRRRRAIVLTWLLPAELRLGPNWLLPAIEAVLLVALVFGDPGVISRRTRALRAFSIALVAILVLNSLWSTALLIDVLINGGNATNSAGELLEAGSIVWASNNIAFALLYWELDGGGAAARAYDPPSELSFAFPQHLNPLVRPPGWRPRFIDYLYLGFTNATALSPTDVMPLVPWAKIAMAVQSVISLAILALVVARAVNVLT